MRTELAPGDKATAVDARSGSAGGGGGGSGGGGGVSSSAALAAAKAEAAGHEGVALQSKLVALQCILSVRVREGWWWLCGGVGCVTFDREPGKKKNINEHQH